MASNKHHVPSSPSKNAARRFRSLLHIESLFRKPVETSREAISETAGLLFSSSSQCPLPQHVEDANDSNASDRVNHTRPLTRKLSLPVNRGRPSWKIALSMKSMYSSDSNATDRVNHRRPVRKKSLTMKSMFRPLKNRLRSRGSRRSIGSRNRDRSVSRKSQEDWSDRVDDFELSYSIMPRLNLDYLTDADDHEDDNYLKAVDEAERVELLAVSRTPSFNIMLHANDIYSDSCTLLKCKSMRISWEDLAHNTNSIEGKEGEAQEAEDVVFVKHMRRQGSVLVRRPSGQRMGSNYGGVSLWSHTSTITLKRDFGSFIIHEKAKEWLKNFKSCDPRYRILKFFNDVANEGATGDSVNFARDHVSPLLKYFNRASVFTVWRPTSLQSIRRMMLGEGVGKGLDIKGKSAKRGKLSAFVPFLQIFEEEHKASVRTLHKDCKIRIFFNSKRDRDLVVINLNELAEELEETVRGAKQIIKEESKHDEETVESAMKNMTFDMVDSTINLIDAYASSKKYGMEVQERLFWEGMVIRQKIHRKPGSADDTGRTSMPSFQDMNFASLREPRNDVLGGHTRAVILQYNPPGEENNNPMNPLNLLMAYEENDPDADRLRVIPVVSDFDCFTVGTRGVRYEEKVPEDQIKILKWMVQQTETILEKQTFESWTKRWVDVLKDCGNKGFYPKVPSGGYSDPKTRFIFGHAINRLGITGAVRHGAECFNYVFPQELDDNLLVISDELPDEYNGRNWVYVNQDELKDILKFKIDKGYTFPLNPKWVLCHQGWKEVYDKLIASNRTNVQQSLNCFYPPESGLRELIEKIYKNHPDGFQRLEDEHDRRLQHSKSTRLSFIEGTAAMDLAQQELKYFMILQRAKQRLRAYLRMNSILNNLRNVQKENDKTETEIEEDNNLDQKKEILI